MRRKILIAFMAIILGGSFCNAGHAQETGRKANDIYSLLSSEGKVLFGAEPNSILVIDYPENINRVKEYLEVVDTPPDQVHIEARVVEVKLEGEHSLGVNWSLFAAKEGVKIGSLRMFSSTIANGIAQAIPYKPTYYPPLGTAGQETPFTLTVFDDNINIVLRALSNQLRTNILSAPSITTVNNHEAKLEVIEVIPWAEPEVTTQEGGQVDITWNVNFEEVGIILKVTPIINEEGRISMVLEPEVSESTEDVTLTVRSGTEEIDYTIPIIDKRSAKTKVIVGSAQTLIMGGLIKNKEKKGETKVPLLGDIPLLGYFFKSEKDTVDKTELLIFVSPTIITSKEIEYMTEKDESLPEEVVGASILGIKRPKMIAKTEEVLTKMPEEKRKEQITGVLDRFEQKMRKRLQAGE